MIFNRRHKEILRDQQGVTLLLSILILAAITAIVFSIAAIAINETRVSGDLIKSEPAVTAAEAGAEDVLYYDIRGLSSYYSTDCSSPSSSTFNSVTLKYCSNPYLTNPYSFSVPAKSGGINGEKDFFLYNATVPGGPPGYTNIIVTLNDGVSGTINICSWTNNTCAASADIASFSLTTGNNQSQVLDPNAATGYQVILLNSNSTADNFTINTTPNGMPSGTATIQTTGSNNGVTRKIQTILPQ